MHSVDSSSFGHALLRSDAVVSIAGKKPREEIDGGDGHANTEKHAGKHTLRATFTKSERKTSHDNGYEREAARDGAGEGRHQDVHGIFPGGIAALRERGGGKEETERNAREISGSLLERNSSFAKIYSFECPPPTHRCFRKESRRVLAASVRPDHPAPSAKKNHWPARSALVVPKAHVEHMLRAEGF